MAKCGATCPSAPRWTGVRAGSSRDRCRRTRCASCSSGSRRCCTSSSSTRMHRTRMRRARGARPPSRPARRWQRGSSRLPAQDASTSSSARRTARCCARRSCLASGSFRGPKGQTARPTNPWRCTPRRPRPSSMCRSARRATSQLSSRSRPSWPTGPPRSCATCSSSILRCPSFACTSPSNRHPPARPPRVPHLESARPSRTYASGWVPPSASRHPATPPAASTPR
mmetsp:Transcript_34638/g.110223  ORF Transcript_34638/g.110223 Transcript_34638/m.110223 type:complete len:226 (+) Transcript_34638:962-1639(+)